MDLKIDGITARIHEKADRELERELDAMLKPLWELHSACHLGEIELAISGGNGQMAKVNSYTIIRALKENVMANKGPKNRELAIARFLERVESLAADVEDLRNAVENS